MNITINGQASNVFNDNTIADIINTYNLQPDSIVIEHNQQIIQKENWSKIVLANNDKLEIVRFVGGG
ncbi:MAG: thiamine biosynthesis protein ThiS [Candidatus Margulisbacteria bacterium GWF2_35_9]|nr:MAG: thiamine biosynthesis protein ThiS [Candidatus Margulisbacteria bacterium GWF2_35_9]